MVKRAFSLIELLVVIAVVAILLAISASALHRVRQNTKTLLCQFRVRQWQLALIEYDQREMCLPLGFDIQHRSPPGGSAGIMSTDWSGWWWFHYLGFKSPSPFHSSPLFICPSKELDSASLQDNELWGNYGVNWSLCRSNGEPSQFINFRGMPKSISQIKGPSRLMLVADSGYTLVSWYHATRQPPQKLKERPGFETSYVPGLSINRDRYLLPAQQADAIGGRHPNKTINVGYVDGHVERIKAEETLVEQDGDVYRGVSPFWDPK